MKLTVTDLRRLITESLDSPPWNPETEEERTLIDDLEAHYRFRRPIDAERIMSLIDQGKYLWLLQPSPNISYVYRGLYGINAATLTKWLGVQPTKTKQWKHHQARFKLAGPKEQHGQSSWTTNVGSAEEFAAGYGVKHHAEFSDNDDLYMVVVRAPTQGNLFVLNPTRNIERVKQLKNFVGNVGDHTTRDGFSMKETVALQPVNVDLVKYVSMTNEQLGVIDDEDVAASEAHKAGKPTHDYVIMIDLHNNETEPFEFRLDRSTPDEVYDELIQIRKNHPSWTVIKVVKNDTI